jgi:ABC-type lipoprotein release transport system permease subunit
LAGDLAVVTGFLTYIDQTLFLRTLLFGIIPLDPITFTAVAVVLLAAAALASYLPARPTAAVDPVEALRTE